jgi:thymidine phosphorylase
MDREIDSDEIDEVLNPHRGEEQTKAREHTYDILAQRGVLLTGEETDEELADLWSAVDRFESLVEARGGDTESASDYTRRIMEAAKALTNFER